jgi:formylglycine-generating enzyme required for sulfatase activity
MRARQAITRILLIALAASSCKKDECLGGPAQAQIDVELEEVAAAEVSAVDVTLTINSATPMTRTFATPTPSFVFDFGDQDAPPHSLSILAVAHDSAGKILGHGATSVTFTSDACNFFTVAVKPGGGSDASPDAAPSCGDQKKNGTEQCDGSDFGKITSCTQLGFSGGSLRCTSACKLSGCLTSGYVSIPAGTFSMGSASTESCRYSEETQHQVSLTRGFEISDHEVTQGEFLALMTYNPSDFTTCGMSCPVNKVSWYNATAYCNTLSTKMGLTPCYTCKGTGLTITCEEAATYSGTHLYACPGFRLPTEAEWEYAYRSGTATAYYNGANDSSACYTCSTTDANADAIAWYCANASSTTHAVKQKLANVWGLYDMAGNVQEWVNDWYQLDPGSSVVTDPVGASSGTMRLLRGGSWSHYAVGLRAANRAYRAPESQVNLAGFRCARTLSP